jgi:hypothetical protein
MKFAKIASVAMIIGLLSSSDLRGDRVGFRFEGTLQAGTGSITLFGITVPGNSPIAGTFSYDTTAPGVDGDPGVKNFAQVIQGGYSLKVGNAISLSASKFVVAVGNDFQRQQPPETVDLFSVNFNRLNPIVDPPILVNGNAWPSIGYIRIELSWPQYTFTEPDEPKLTSDKPLIPNFSPIALLGSSVTPRFFSINSISAIAPLAGDYNRNGVVEANDYAEWRRAFGATSAEFLCADGNGDGIVDAADYVVWRGAAAPGSSLGVGLRVPEPTTLALSLVCLLALAAQLRKMV